MSSGTGAAGRAVVWNVGGSAGTISVQMPAALAQGGVHAVTGAPSGGGWGVIPSATVAAGVQLRTADNVERPAAGGTLTALSRSPVRMRLDARLLGGAGGRTLVGDVAFTSRTIRASCS